MFNCNITAQDLILQLREETDIAYPVTDASYIIWLNAIEQLLYGEIIREQKRFILKVPNDSVIDFSVIEPDAGEDAIRFEDIHTIYADDTQLIKSTVASGVIFPNTFYKTHNKLGLNLDKKVDELTIIYFARPVLKTEDNIEREFIRVPAEFIELIRAKLRGEAYKLANEDELAAKWLNDYNVLLENFKVWISEKSPDLGM